MELRNPLLAVVLATVSLLASAQSVGATGVDQRQVNQEKRIQQGVQSGSLTGREAARLEDGQARVQSQEDKVKADGVVTNHERARLQHLQSRQSDRIYRQKHDRQHDYNHDGRIDRPARRNP
jgi:hypothetical protein